MGNTLHEMTQDIQVRIRELAYLMWESAGRQQGTATEYWLRAESEVLSTLQAAAVRLMPGLPHDAPKTAAPAEPAPASIPAPVSDVPAPAMIADLPVGRDPAIPVGSDAGPLSAAKKPAPPKAPARSKVRA